MATVNAVILKHQKKLDGTWNVKICVNHKSSPKYFDTSAFVTKSSLDTKGKLKQSYIDKHFAQTLTDYREKILNLGDKLNFMSPSDVRDYLKNKDSLTSRLDLFYELELKISRLKELGKISQSYIFTSVLNHLKDFVKGPELNPLSVSPQFLSDFERHLTQDKYLVRRTCSGGSTKPILTKGVSINGIVNYMSYFRTIFNEVRKKHNNPTSNYFPIPHTPFDYYDMPKATPVARRNLSIERISQIIDYTPIGVMEETAKDLFILSLCLCGMNPKDMYVYLTNPNVTGAIEYGRSKVKDHRRDGGITNVSIPEQVQQILVKYAGNIQQRYSTNLGLNRVLHKGWSSISEKLGFKCTMYYARHSFSNIARSVCKFSKDDVSFALNHKYGISITDTYLEPDWSVVHKVQHAVVDVVFNRAD